jgi:hypothetical protein
VAIAATPDGVPAVEEFPTMTHTLTGRLGALPTAMLVLATVPAIAAAEAPRFSLGAGAEYTTGDYGGTDSVDEFYLPVTATLDFERIGLRLTVPFLSVSAPELTTITGPDGQPVIGVGPRVTESGLGDVLASITVYDVLTVADGDFTVDLTGKVKFGTADEDKGLGTGEQDYSVQADIFRFFDRATLMGTAGYTFRGDPAGYALDDAFFAALGASYATTEQTRVGAFFDVRDASVPDTDMLQELSAWVSMRVGDRSNVQAYVLAGVGDSSPDWGGGLSFDIHF